MSEVHHAPHPPPQAVCRPRVLLVSIALNGILLLVLAIAAFRGVDLRRWADPAGRSVPARTPSGVPEAPGAGLGSGVSGPDKTLWSRLSSDDPRIFAARLREVGCPERTVGDLVVPAVKRWVKQRTAQLDRHDPFWVTGPARATLQERHAVDLLALVREGIQLVHALGCEVDFGWRERDMHAVALVELFSGFLGPVKQHALEQLFLELSAWRELVEGPQAHGSGTRTETVAWQTVVADLRAGLDRVLTPAERQELELRLSVLKMPGVFSGGNFEGVEFIHPSSEEMREFVRIQAQPETNLLEDLMIEGNVGKPSIPQEESAAPALKALLGADRYAQYLRVTDPTYQAVQAAVRKENLPEGVVAALHELAGGFAAELVPIQAAWEEAPEEARRTLEAWQNSKRARVDALLAGLPDTRRTKLSLVLVNMATQASWPNP